MILNKYEIDKNILKICWYGIVQKTPEIFEPYDIYLTLHRPYIKEWSKRGLKSYELQPAFDRRQEKYDMQDKPIDFLFYGQYGYDGYRVFKNRNRLIDELLEYSLKSNFNIKIHLQLGNLKKPYLDIPFFRRFKRDTAQSAFATVHTSSPLYGQLLYEAIVNRNL